jgi:hypothetical protein
MKAILSILNTFAGPIGGLVEKGILAGVMWALGKGYIAGDAAGLAASIYAAVSAVFTATVGTQSAKAQSIVETQGNGITVVPKVAADKAGIASVTETQPSAQK